MRFSSVGGLAVSALVGIGALVVVIGAHNAGSLVASAQTTAPSASAVMRTAAGDAVGQVTFTQEAGRVMIHVTASGLPAGFHGFHVHNVAECDAPDFTSAGSHFDPMAMDNAPMHSGDLPSLLVNQDGTAALQVDTDRFSVSDLLSGSGTAVIVHANPDNFANIPARYTPAPDATTLATGDAGARIACGVVTSAS
jgi:Cu-Zn family superoxide dismutase